MRFLVQWKVPLNKRRDVLEAFANMSTNDDQADHGDTIKLIGRYSMPNWKGFAIVETDDPTAIMGWMINWMDAIDDIDVTPIVSDEEGRALGKQKLSQ
jgi:hypothetical protein